MTNEHPFTPPPELRQLWAQQAQRIDPRDPVAWLQHVATRAARWGADQQLERIIHWLVTGPYGASIVASAPSLVADLRAACRPKPLSDKEQALADLDSMSIEPCLINGIDVNAAVRAKYDNIRRALKALPDNS